MKCPQCGTDVPDHEWNCPSCRINAYWASQHYEELARIRQQRGLPVKAPTPAFLIKTHESAMGERPDRHVEHKVRQIARMVMRQKAT